MLHKNRVFHSPIVLTSLHELENALRAQAEDSHGGDLSHAVKYNNFLFVNDSTGVCGSFCEYAIFDIARKGQVEAWTLNWIFEVDNRADSTETTIDERVADLATARILEPGLPFFA